MGAKAECDNKGESPPELPRTPLLGTSVNSPRVRHERFESMLTKSDLPED
jgi:hypothetical protein